MCRSALKRQRDDGKQSCSKHTHSHSLTHAQFPVGEAFYWRCVKTNEPQVGDECGRVCELRLGDNRRNTAVCWSLLPSFPNRTPASAFSSSPPVAPTGCPRGSPLQEHHVTTLTPASPRPGQKRDWEPCEGERREGGRRRRGIPQIGVRGPPGAPKGGSGGSPSKWGTGFFQFISIWWKFTLQQFILEQLL